MLCEPPPIIFYEQILCQEKNADKCEKKSIVCKKDQKV